MWIRPGRCCGWGGFGDLLERRSHGQTDDDNQELFNDRQTKVEMSRSIEQAELLVGREDGNDGVNQTDQEERRRQGHGKEQALLAEHNPRDLGSKCQEDEEQDDPEDDEDDNADLAFHGNVDGDGVDLDVGATDDGENQSSKGDDEDALENDGIEKAIDRAAHVVIATPSLAPCLPSRPLHFHLHS